MRSGKVSISTNKSLIFEDSIMKYLFISIFIFAASFASADNKWYGAFTTETIPSLDCEIVGSAQRGYKGHWLETRQIAHAKFDEAVSLFLNDAKKDGFNAIVGYNPDYNVAISPQGYVLISWYITGVGIKTNCK